MYIISTGMIQPYITNGMQQTTDLPKTKKEAHNKAKEYRSQNIYAIVLKDIKKYTIWIPI